MAVSLSLLALMMASYEVLYPPGESAPAESLRLMTHHLISITQPMPMAFEARIRAVPGVRDVMVWQWFGGTYRDARDQRNFFARFAIEPERLFRIRSELEMPKEEKLAFERTRTACIAGRKLAERFHWKPGDRITLMGDIFPVNLELTVAGVFHATDDDENLFFHYDYLRELLKASGQGADEVGVFQVQVNSATDIDRVAAAIDQEFENSPAPTRTETERAWQLSFVSFLGDLKLFLSSICAALVFTILLVSANTISMSVRDRSREVGILKTLGFTPAMIVGLIVSESALISCASGCLGLGLTSGVCVFVRYSGSAFAATNVGVTPGMAAIMLLLAAFIGTAGALIPAWNAARKPILDSLRFAG
jgi:putative ABC transport system permease protein